MGGLNMSYLEELRNRVQQIEKGGNEKYHKQNEEKGKLFVRNRLELLLDEGIDIEDAFLLIVWMMVYHQTVLSPE